ncbi:MAG: ABC transporter permease [Gammaproteobacteria bacterium]
MKRWDFLPSQVATIAGKEFWDRIRSLWVLAIALVFTAFALGIAYFGGAQQGAVGFRSLDFTLASLVSLVIYLVPLIALVLGFDAVVGERERGSLDLLLSMPLTRGELLLGKYLGLAAALGFSTVAGFGAVALVLAPHMDVNGLAHYGVFIVSSVLLGCAFLSLAVLISVVASDRTRASGLAIALWFVFVLMYDLLLLGGLVVGADTAFARLVPYLLLLNPADVFRVWNIAALDEVAALYGLASVLPGELARPTLLAGVLLAWCVAPLMIAAWRFRR